MAWTDNPLRFEGFWMDDDGTLLAVFIEQPHPQEADPAAFVPEKAYTFQMTTKLIKIDDRPTLSQNLPRPVLRPQPVVEPRTPRFPSTPGGPL